MPKRWAPRVSWPGHLVSAVVVRTSLLPRAAGTKRRADGVSEYGWSLFLVIGPLDGIDRTAFVTRLRSLLNAAFAGNSSGHDSDFVPTVRQGKISPIFFSLLKWKLAARDVLNLEKELIFSARIFA